MALPFPKPEALSPALEMSCVTPEDVESLAALHIEAFSADPGNTVWWPTDKSLLRQWAVQRSATRLDAPNVRFFTIKVRETGELIAYSRWCLPAGMTGLGGKEGGVENTTDSNKAKYDGLSLEEKLQTFLTGFETPEGANREAFDDIFSKIFTAQVQHGADKMLSKLTIAAQLISKFSQTDQVGLEVLCTSPRFERRGAARALMEPVLAVADAQGITTWLEASPAGTGLYEKLGFETTVGLDIDLSKGGRGTGTYILRCMERKPVGPKTFE